MDKKKFIKLKILNQNSLHWHFIAHDLFLLWGREIYY